MAVMFTAFFLSACGAVSGTNMDNASEVPEAVEKEAIPENGEVQDGEAETEEAAENIKAEAEPEELSENAETEAEQDSSDTEAAAPEILDFVDVYGVHYETEILKEVPQYPYDYSLLQRDGEMLSYVGDPDYTSRLGIDVSYHQGSIDWQQVADAGFDFVILRVAYRGYGESGSLNKDKNFDEYIKGAQAVGLDVGVYIFSQAINEEEAAEEANLVLDCLQGYELQLPVVYDPESILDAPARTDDVSGEQFTANTLKFCEIIEQAGYEPMIYSNMLWEAFQFDMTQTCKYPYWYADYEALPQTPYDFVMWQYSNTGHVPGVSGETDLDIIFEKTN